MASTVRVGRRALAVKVPGDIDDHDSPVAAHQQNDLEQIGAAVVQQALPPVTHHQLRHQYAHLPVACFLFHFQHVINYRLQNIAIRRLERDQFWQAAVARFERLNNLLVPFRAEGVNVFPDLYVHAAHVGRNRQRE